jgi:hypothetical protein
LVLHYDRTTSSREPQIRVPESFSIAASTPFHQQSWREEVGRFQSVSVGLARNNSIPLHIFLDGLITSIALCGQVPHNEAGLLQYAKLEWNISLTAEGSILVDSRERHADLQAYGSFEGFILSVVQHLPTAGK